MTTTTTTPTTTPTTPPTTTNTTTTTTTTTTADTDGALGRSFARSPFLYVPPVPAGHDSSISAMNAGEVAVALAVAVAVSVLVHAGCQYCIRD